MPAINPLPTPPSRNDPANFSDRADAFLAALPAYTAEANALLDDVHTSRDTALQVKNDLLAVGLADVEVNAESAAASAASAIASKNAAEAAQSDIHNNWQAKLDSAAASAATATSKADIATVQATNAAASASSASSSAASASASVTTASSKADLATAQANAATSAKTAAEAARDAATVNANVYASTVAGLAATTDGQQFQVVSGSEIIRYVRTNSTTATEVARYPSASAVAPLLSIDELNTLRQRYLDGLRTSGATKPKAAVVVLLGQSLNAPRGTIVAQRGAPTAKMPVGGAATPSWQFYATNATWVGHWSELASTADFEERTGQTPMVGIVNTITGGKFARTYIGSVAIGARSLEVLMTGGPVTNLWAMLYRLCAMARADGYDPEVMFYTAHGEANAAAATTEQAYYDLGKEYYGRAQLYAAQAVRKPGYVAPVAFTYPAPGTIAGATYAEVKEAIRRLARDLPGGIDLGGIYQWPTESDRVHPTGVGYIQRGEAVGKALRAYAEDGKKWGSVNIIDVTLSGTEFVATFSAPVQRDATLNVGQNLNTALAEDGFEWFDNGTQVGITALTYEGWKVRGTLASAPVGAINQQVLRIASQTITSALVAGADNLPGSVVREQGGGWPSIQNPAYTNQVWAAPQVFNSVRAA